MRERQIHFSDPMVRAILDGRKTQTRRPIQGHHVVEEGPQTAGLWRIPWPSHPRLVAVCPFGAPGDRLWVRETFKDWALSGAGEPWRIQYRADGGHVDLPSCPDDEWLSCPNQWRPSVHMPRWASRLTLQVISVRVERLRDITEEDARAEGLPPNWTGPLDQGRGGRDEHGNPIIGWRPDLHGFLGPNAERFEDSYEDENEAWSTNARRVFGWWWDSIYGGKPSLSWEAGPWVWVVDFERVGTAP